MKGSKRLEIILLATFMILLCIVGKSYAVENTENDKSKSNNVVNTIENNISNSVNGEDTNSEKTNDKEQKEYTENGIKYRIDEFNQAIITGTTNTSATTIEIPNYVENNKYEVRKIGERAFADNKTLEKVIFKDGGILKTIENEAFKGCINLKEIVFPEDDDSIWLDHKSIFAGTKIEVLNISLAVNMYATALDGMTNLKKIYASVKGYESPIFFEDNHPLDESTIKYLKENVTIYSYSISDYDDDPTHFSNLSPKGFANRHGIKFIDLATLKQNTLTSEGTNISVSVNSADNANIVVNEIDKNSDLYKELESKYKNLDIQLAYDISIEGDYEGNIKVSLPVGSKYEGKTVTVLHYCSDGTVDRYRVVVVDGKVSVDVSELSPFVILTDRVPEKTRKGT